jgi:hypothetical protein
MVDRTYLMVCDQNYARWETEDSFPVRRLADLASDTHIAADLSCDR